MRLPCTRTSRIYNLALVMIHCEKANSLRNFCEADCLSGLVAADALGGVDFMNKEKQELKNTNKIATSNRPAPVAALPLARFAINPLKGLSFEDSRKLEALSQVVNKNVLTAIGSIFGIDAVDAALQLSVLQQGGQLVHFNHPEYALVKTTTGVYKAMTRTDSGAFHEIGNIDTFRTGLNGIAHATATVVAVAHLISNADISKRLSKVIRNTDRLLEIREDDILIKIRSTYESLRGETGKVEPEVRTIEDCRKTFRDNRHLLFKDVQRKINRWELIIKDTPYGMKGPLGVFYMFKTDFENFANTNYNTKDVNERKQALNHVMIKLRDASYCLQMEGLAASYSGYEDDQQQLYREAYDEWSRLASQIEPFETEMRIENPISIHIQKIANIWHVE